MSKPGHTNNVTACPNLVLHPFKLCLLTSSIEFNKTSFAGETPDENDLFPSTPLDEEQLRHYNAQEELGSVVINQVEEQEVS